MSKPETFSSDTSTGCEWWKAKQLGRQPHEILDTLVHQLEDDQESRYAAYREYARLYGCEPEMFGNDDAFVDLFSDSVTQNELANTIETLHAQIFKNRIVPAVSVVEADWEEWERGKALSRWIEGVFDAGKVHYNAMPRAGLGMLVKGTGFVKVGHEEDADGHCTLTFHPLDASMFLVDRLEAKKGCPRNFYEKDYQDKYLIAEKYGTKQSKGMFGSKEDRLAKILECGLASNGDIDAAIGTRTKSELLCIREAWHMPTKKGAKDGRHCIWIKGCTLVDEVWDWDRTPHMVMRFGTRLDGFYGESAVKRLAPTQRQFDKLNKKIDEAQDIMGVPRIIMGRDSHIERAHLDDIPGGILEVDGDINNAIREWNATAVAPELYQERSSAPDKMRSLLGVTQFDTQNQLPPGLREVSGPALERIVDQGTARHALIHAEIEHAIMDLAYLAMDYAAELEKEGKCITVTGPGIMKSSVELLKFSEVKVDRKRMKLMVQPMSQMPQTFAGKVEQFSKLYADKAISKQAYLRMVEVPDPGGAVDILGSDEEIILKNLHFMVKKGKYIPPLQYDNLDLIVPLTTAFINHYRIRDGADMEKVGMLSQYIEDAILLKKGLGGTDPNAPPPPMPPMGPGMPGIPPQVGPDGMPMAPPMDPSMGGQMAPPGMPPAGPMPPMPPPGMPMQ